MTTETREALRKIRDYCAEQNARITAAYKLADESDEYAVLFAEAAEMDADYTMMRADYLDYVFELLADDLREGN